MAHNHPPDQANLGCPACARYVGHWWQLREIEGREARQMDGDYDR